MAGSFTIPEFNSSFIITNRNLVRPGVNPESSRSLPGVNPESTRSRPGVGQESIRSRPGVNLESTRSQPGVKITIITHFQSEIHEKLQIRTLFL
jgi:hypothetical protein